MTDHIEWKEAKSGQDFSESGEQSDAEFNSDWTEDEEANHNPSHVALNSVHDPSQPDSSPIYQRINLGFRRNITALADINQHKSKPAHDISNKHSRSFDQWLEDALVSISPNGDLIIFASASVEKVIFVAKLRKEPINQYITKPLNVPLDHTEQITSLLCLPIMSNQRTAVGLVDWTALVIGLSSGYVKFYTEQSICLLILKFCDEPVISLKCQTQKMNPNARSELHFPSISDEVLISYPTSSIVIDGLGMVENLRVAQRDAVQNGPDYEPAYSSANLPSILSCQRWKPEDLRSSKIIDADLLGTRKKTTFDSLVSDSINFDKSHIRSCARTVVFVGRNPFISCCFEPKDLSSHSYTEMIGSIFSYWNKPEPSRLQQLEVSKASNLSLYDKERLATSIVTSPDRRLAAVTDDYGRVLLLDATNMIVTRIWKGYRSAQCGWVEVQQDPELPESPRASFLVIYAPKRGLLEVWSAQKGPRVAAFNVGKSCRLLYCGYKMFNMRAGQIQRGNRVGRLIDQPYSSSCYLLNAKSETVFAIDLPFSYSLYKYDDLKSRDRLLINELSGIIGRVPENEIISDILHRLVLAESVELSIQMIANNLEPDQIVPIMENLVNNIMRNYDNHSGEKISDEDTSTVELCKRLIRLCSIFQDLSKSTLQKLPLPDVNQRLIDEYEEHPQEIDDFSEQLNWSTSEILRFLSLLALERSYRKDHIADPWPSIGEPLTWAEFISCFDLRRQHVEESVKKTSDIGKICIQLKEISSNFLSQDRVMKTALFMYNNLSEAYYRSTISSSKQSADTYSSKSSDYNILDPSSRLALLFQFWMSTKLCNNWKMWAFLQNQVGQISDELKVSAMSQNSDNILIETWKKIYNMILESDNIFASIIATAAIKGDTIRMIQDDQKREKLEEDLHRDHDDENPGRHTVDWETLCLDAERMSLLSQQLEDVFLLNLLLKYSVNESRLVEGYLYRVPRISAASIMRGGPTIVSELVAQWAVQSDVRLDIFTQSYGDHNNDQNANTRLSLAHDSLNRVDRSKPRYFSPRIANVTSEEHAKELIHHVKTSFPCSLNSDVILVHCIWESCRRWTTDNFAIQDKCNLLDRASYGLSMLSNILLRHKVASVAFKTFFQRIFERLIILVETNASITSAKSGKIRDKIVRKELNITDDCLMDFVQFCCNLSEFMLQTSNNNQSTEQDRLNEVELHNRLLRSDDWWSISELGKREYNDFGSDASNDDRVAGNSLIKTTLYSSDLIDINTLVEMNRVATLMNLVFRLNIIKAYPITLIGEESRQILHLDQQHISAPEVDKDKSSSLASLRQKFARKCIVNIVRKMADEVNSFCGDDESISDEERYDDAIEGPDNDFRNENSSNQDQYMLKQEDCLNNEAMVLFADLLSLSNEWKLDCDELQLELVFELYRCNLDKIGLQISNRVLNQKTLATGLLKIASQRVLILFGLSPQFADSSKWNSRSDRWSLFQPNVASWLKGIQQEEIRRELASLSFSESLKQPDSVIVKETFGVEVFVVHAIRNRTKLILDIISNHLDGQASRLSYDLLQLLESRIFDRFLEEQMNQ